MITRREDEKENSTCVWGQLLVIVLTFQDATCTFEHVCKLRLGFDNYYGDRCHDAAMLRATRAHILREIGTMVRASSQRQTKRRAKRREQAAAAQAAAAAAQQQGQQPQQPSTQASIASKRQRAAAAAAIVARRPSTSIPPSW